MVNILELNSGEYKGTYKIVGGYLCLDFTNTVSYRNRETPHEWLNTFENLCVWCQLTGVLNESDANELLYNLKLDSKKGWTKLNALHELREVIFKIFTPIADKKNPENEDINYFNTLIQKQISSEKIVYNKDSFYLEWTDDLSNYKKIIHHIYKSTIDLMTQADLTRINKCKACYWLFYDTSRNRSRQWCVMADCGNRNKANNYNKRKRDL